MYGSSCGFVFGKPVVQSQVERNVHTQANSVIWSCNSLPILADKASVDEVLSRLSTTQGMASILEETLDLSL